MNKKIAFLFLATIIIVVIIYGIKVSVDDTKKNKEASTQAIEEMKKEKEIEKDVVNNKNEKTEDTKENEEIEETKDKNNNNEEIEESKASDENKPKKEEVTQNGQQENKQLTGIEPSEEFLSEEGLYIAFEKATGLERKDLTVNKGTTTAWYEGDDTEGEKFEGFLVMLEENGYFLRYEISDISGYRIGYYLNHGQYEGEIPTFEFLYNVEASNDGTDIALTITDGNYNVEEKEVIPDIEYMPSAG